MNKTENRARMLSYLFIVPLKVYFVSASFRQDYLIFHEMKLNYFKNTLKPRKLSLGHGIPTELYNKTKIWFIFLSSTLHLMVTASPLPA